MSRAARPALRTPGTGGLLAGILIAGSLLVAADPAPGAPYIWDEDTDRIDDRIEATALFGIQAAYEDADTTGRLRFAAFLAAGILSFDVYVGFDHPPTAADLVNVTLAGASVRVRYRSIPYLRATATWAQVQAIAALPGVTRVEAVPALHPMNNVGAGTIQARPGTACPAPDVETVFGVRGRGATVAVLDTGVNDAPAGLYPGHSALAGKVVGGGYFFAGDSTLNTPFTASANPSDLLGGAGGYHGTHVAATILGTGGANEILRGVAPEARLVDVKVLSDAGVGFGVADGIEWCIQNRTRSWGLSGPDTVFAGIDVINLSLSSIDRSDGNDADAQIANAAAAAGIVVVAAMGNDGRNGFVPSPASADRAVAVGAVDDRNTCGPSDDLPAAFSNTGPRDSDGDLDLADEIRPTVLAPGVGIASANGDPSTDGNALQVLSGTSMASAFASGTAALLRSAAPGLSSGEVARILRETAGDGVVNACAALEEALTPASTQVVRLRGAGSASPAMADVEWETQRERPASSFRVERAPDEGGSPGAWTTLGTGPVAAAGDSSLTDGTNRRIYTHHDADPGLQDYATHWYRVRVDDPGGAFETPAIRVRLGAPAPVATVAYTIVHTTPDHDLLVRIGGGFPTNPAWEITGPGAVEADSFQVVPGEASQGILRWFFRRDVEAWEIAPVGAPPDGGSPWFLAVTEGGYLNRGGRIESFTIDAPGGLLEAEAGVPTPTVEGATATLFLPEGTTLGTPEGRRPPGPSLRASFHPNPFRPDAALRVTVPEGLAGAWFEVRIFDARGRSVRRLHLGPLPGGEVSLRWNGRDGSGRDLPSGEYFFRVEGGGVRAAGKVVLVR